MTKSKDPDFAPKIAPRVSQLLSTQTPPKLPEHCHPYSYFHRVYYYYYYLIRHCYCFILLRSI